MIHSWAIVLQYSFRFAMGAFGCKNHFLVANKGSVGATLGFRFVIVVWRQFCCAHLRLRENRAGAIAALKKCLYN